MLCGAHVEMKKALGGDANTAHWRSQKFRHATDPLPRGTGQPKFNQLEMITTCTYEPSLVRIDAHNFKLSWQQTHKQTDRTDYNTLCRSFVSTQCKNLYAVDTATETAEKGSRLYWYLLYML